jgi:hypothetical protein
MYEAYSKTLYNNWDMRTGYNVDGVGWGSQEAVDLYGDVAAATSYRWNNWVSGSGYTVEPTSYHNPMDHGPPAGNNPNGTGLWIGGPGSDGGGARPVTVYIVVSHRFGRDNDPMSMVLNVSGYGNRYYGVTATEGADNWETAWITGWKATG